jgi:RNase H-like domain found in reverse transcriptase
VWGEKHQHTFEALKVSFSEAPILIHFDPNNPIVVETDASDYAIAGRCSSAAGWRGRMRRRVWGVAVLLPLREHHSCLGAGAGHDRGSEISSDMEANIDSEYACGVGAAPPLPLPFPGRCEHKHASLSDVSDYQGWEGLRVHEIGDISVPPVSASASATASVEDEGHHTVGDAHNLLTDTSYPTVHKTKTKTKTKTKCADIISTSY